MQTKNLYNLKDSTVYIKWKPGDSSTYSGFSVCISSIKETYDVYTGAFNRVFCTSYLTTHHSYANSIVINNNTWYYTRAVINNNIVNYYTAVNNYDD